MDQLYSEISRSISRYNFHPLQRALYTYDVLSIPSIIRRFIKMPEVIVQPENDSEVLNILKIAYKFKIPIIPRGAATSAYGGVLPLRKSIIVDFTRMKSFEVDKKKKLLIAESGVVWWDIEKEIRKEGLSLRMYPTSAPASTVGGWIAQNGYGIGSLKYGSIGENIEWVDVADFGGIRRVSGDELKYYIGMCGTTGLILRACIRLRDYKEIKSLAVDTDLKSIEDLIGDVYHACYLSEKFLKWSGIESESTLILCQEDGESNELGEIIWENRFQQLRARKKGEIVLSEVVLPLETFIEFYKEVEKMGAGIEIQFTKDQAIFFVIFLVNDEKSYYSAVFKALKTVKIAEKYGGRVYSSGMLFSYKSGKIYPNYDELLKFKQKVDPFNLLNPGKVFGHNAVSRIIKLAERLIV